MNLPVAVLLGSTAFGQSTPPPVDSYAVDPPTKTVWLVQSTVALGTTGTPKMAPEPADLCCDESAYPEEFDRTVFVGNVVTGNDSAPDGSAVTTYYLDTSNVSGAANDKTVSAMYYSMWACSDAPPTNDEIVTNTDIASATYTVAEVTKIQDADAGTAYLREENGKDVLATVKDGGTAVLHAICNPDVKEVHDVLVWGGAEVSDDDKTFATVERTSSERLDVTVSINEVARRGTLWIVWGSKPVLLFEDQDDTTLSPEKPPRNIKYGVNDRSFQDGVLIQCTLTPKGVETVKGINYRFRQTVESGSWLYSYGEWLKYDTVPAGSWDGPYLVNQALTPTNKAHIYMLDTPGFPFVDPVPQRVSKQQFKTIIQIDPGTGEFKNGSDTLNWFCITWLETINGKTQRKAGQNFIQEGTIEIPQSDLPGSTSP